MPCETLVPSQALRLLSPLDPPGAHPLKARIASLPGDGIGKEVIAEAVEVLKAVATRYGHEFTIEEGHVGAAGIDALGSALPPETRKLCDAADAILLGAIGDPRYSNPDAKIKPETALLDLRGGYGLFANLRPIKPDVNLLDNSPIKREIIEGVDILFVRELTGGLYFGEKHREENRATDLCVYTTPEIERVVRVACEAAMKRGKKVTSVDKANVLKTSQLWRDVTTRVVAEEYPEIELEHLLVDAVAMHLLTRPRSFDVIVTENLFGDVLTDEASVLCGSLGMLPSASLGEKKPGLYEPIHGSAPDIMGQGIANPYGAILTVAMLLRHALGLEEEALAVEAATAKALESGILTNDLKRSSDGAKTREVGKYVCDMISAPAKV